MEDTVLVTGASGHVGAELVARLAADGRHTRAMTRKPHDLAVPAGVEVVRGDADDPRSLAAAFAGVERAFLVSAEAIDPDAGPTHVPALAEAAARAGVEHLVLLSVLSGGEGDDVLAAWWRRVERAVTGSGLRWTLLRPGRFMSNALAWARQLDGGDAISVPFADRPAASIDPADIAAVAAAALTATDRRHDGAVHRLSGPAAMTPADEVAAIADLLGRPLRAVEPPLDQVRAGMARSGMREAVIDAALARTLEGGDGVEVLPTVEQVLGRPARTFGDWLDAHRDAFTGGRS
ncbi:NAD(P)H-binding protein [Actinomycetospora straminea]|uniref:NAD(P)H-binding protein n=1 Tax=Actinomycetospora straminea TaxID=663607 RepID=A0ABP9EJM8_9PSEU|nr:NAD(P)H-binding protein [Actinomycetospora straminea]MDD7932176.1 NAD(P)H-binding protein [Actinomycetospora straminea]